VNPQFVNAVAQHLAVTGVTPGKSIQPPHDLHASMIVLEAGDPFAEHVLARRIDVTTNFQRTA